MLRNKAISTYQSVRYSYAGLSVGIRFFSSAPPRFTSIERLRASYQAVYQDYQDYAQSSKELAELSKIHAVLYRGDNRTIPVLKKGYVAKGKNKNIADHVKTNASDSNYTSTARNEFSASVFGMPAMRTGSWRSLIPSYRIIHLTAAYKAVDPSQTPLVKYDKHGNVFIDHANEENNFAAKEGETSIVGGLDSRDIIGIKTKFGLSVIAVPIPFGSFTWLNPDFSPTKFSVTLLSACEAQSRRYLEELIQLGRVEKGERYLHPDEVDVVIKTLGEQRYSPLEARFKKQLRITTIEDGIRDTTGYIGEMLAKFEAAAKADYERQIEQLGKGSTRVVDTPTTVDPKVAKAFEEEAAKHVRNLGVFSSTKTAAEKPAEKPKADHGHEPKGPGKK